MNKGKKLKKLILAFIALEILMVGSFMPALAFDGATIYLVRHAERAEDGTNNPPLSKKGEMRAKMFAGMLHGENVTHVFSTPFIRTMDTAAPTAHEHGLEVEEYDPRDSQGLVDRLKTFSGTILVTGHSNTTPGLVNLLVGSDLENLDESVYNNIYIVTFDGNGNGHLEIEHLNVADPSH